MCDFNSEFRFPFPCWNKNITCCPLSKLVLRSNKTNVYDFVFFFLMYSTERVWVDTSVAVLWCSFLIEIRKTVNSRRKQAKAKHSNKNHLFHLFEGVKNKTKSARSFYCMNITITEYFQRKSEKIVASSFTRVNWQIQTMFSKLVANKAVVNASRSTSVLRSFAATTQSNDKRNVSTARSQPSNFMTESYQSYFTHNPVEGYIRNSPYDMSTTPNLALDQYVWQNVSKWPNHIAMVSVIRMNRKYIVKKKGEIN